MLWVIAFIVAVLFAIFATEQPSLPGFLTGFGLVVALGYLARQSRRIDALTDELRRVSARPVPQRSQAPPMRESPADAPIDAPAEAAAATATRDVATPVAGAEPPPIPSRAVIDTDADREAVDRVPPLPDEPGPAVSQQPDEPAVSPQRPPHEPDAVERLAARLKAFIFEGNVPVKIGLIVSLFGVGALIRYAASIGLLDVPVSVRYALIALAALGMLVYGLKQAPVRPAFGLSLQGGAIGILLLTVFGSYRVPGLLPAIPAFVLVLGLVAGAAVLAIRQNAVWIAAIGLLGGYLAPLLLSTGSGNHVALFTWYALLNGAVFGMAWVKPWRALNLMGFVFTFGVGALWGAQYFRPELYATTQPFLALFFLMFVTIPVLYALKGREPGKVDASLLFGTPLIAFPMQVALLDGERMPLAFSALAVGAIYLGIALWSRREEKLRVLAQSSAALGLAFATLAVPLALSARWTSATWALQGVALLWLGQVQNRRWPQVGGVALQALAGFAYVVAIDRGGAGGTGFDGHTLNLLLLALSAGTCAWLFDRRHQRRRSVGGALMWTVASLWWLWTGFREVNALTLQTDIDFGPLWLGFLAVTAALAALMLRTLDWRKPTWWPALGFPLAIPGVAIAHWGEEAWLRTPDGLLLLVLAAALALVLPTLKRTPNRLAVTHISGLAAICLALGLGIREGLGHLNVEALGDGWRWVLPWLPLALLAALLAKRPRVAAWPVGDAIGGYGRIALGLAAAALGIVWVLTLVAPGSAAPLPFVPILNPVELFHVAGLVAMFAWSRRLAAEGARPVADLGLLLAGFLVLSMATLRACLHWLDDPVRFLDWNGEARWLEVASTLQAQAALSVAWALAGVTCWVLGSRRGSRPLWTFGAVLLGLVLLKLLLVDRQNLGDLLGIVSFLVVGGLLVVVGRIAPRPPSRAPESA